MPRFDLASLLDVLPFGVVVWCADSSRPEDLRLMYSNAKTAEESGYDARLMIGSRMGDVLPAATGFWGVKFLKAMETGEPQVVESRFTDDNHPDRIHRVDIIPVDDNCVVVVNKNVTDLREAEASMEQALRRLSAANAELDRFATAVAHDLKVPLAAIEGFATMLLKLADLDAEGRHVTDRLIASSRRAVAMIDDLLDYARHAGPTGERRHVDVEAVVDRAIEALDPTIRQSGAILDREALPPAWGNESAIHQVFLNLLSNSLKYGKRGACPTIRIWSEASSDGDGFVTYSVADDGRGIPPEHRASVFELGVRLGASEEDDSESTGIGLATCAAIVANHGGRIWVEETPGSGGTTVHLTLRAPVETEPPARPRSPRPATVFVVDDDPDSRSLIRLVVRDCGGAVVGAAPEGTAALERLGALEERPDVVVLDHRLPGDDGLTVAGWIRRRWPDQPIVLVTSHLDEQLRIAAHAIGINATLRKQDVGELGGLIGRLGAGRGHPVEAG